MMASAWSATWSLAKMFDTWLRTVLWAEEEPAAVRLTRPLAAANGWRSSCPSRVRRRVRSASVRRHGAGGMGNRADGERCLREQLPTPLAQPLAVLARQRRHVQAGRAVGEGVGLPPVLERRVRGLDVQLAALGVRHTRGGEELRE